jgi:hypothetical protein
MGRGSLHQDGRLLAYNASMSGERRTMVKFIDDDDLGVPMNTERSRSATWAGDRLFAIADHEIIAADVTTQGQEIIVGPPIPIADGEGVRLIAAFPDGKRLLLVRDNKPTKGGSVRIIKNWLLDEDE